MSDAGETTTRTMTLLFVLLVIFPALVQSQCFCDDGATCYANSSLALDCMYSIPFNKGWANQTIEVLSASLENFGFKALYHSTGPPYSINLDIVGELSAARQMVMSNDFSSDLEFQEHIQSVFQQVS